MPPLRSERSGKACENCRKLKTRCLRSGDETGACQRCLLHDHGCSLVRGSESTSFTRNSNDVVEVDSGRLNEVFMRIDRLETTVKSLEAKISSDLPSTSAVDSGAYTPRSSSKADDSAPVLMIRDAAHEIGVQSPDEVRNVNEDQFDILVRTGLSPDDALTMIALFVEHYGRWVRFAEESNPRLLYTRLVSSPLLLCSVLLIAVRHDTAALAHIVAPVLLKEAQSLLARSLLTLARDLDFFRAVLILSLWSTTVGQAPLTTDGWLLTTYALQQTLAHPSFVTIFQRGSTRLDATFIDSWCLWNHLCVAHLQYCVGMQRKSCVPKSQIEASTAMLDRPGLSSVSNFEERMIAEMNLYWIIYEQCNTGHNDRERLEQTLQQWRTRWSRLFEQPRTQFLQMGYYFALLLNTCRCLRACRSPPGLDLLSDLVRLSTSIINLAMNTTDSRTQHLTDHIYHTLTFSAISLCRLLSSHADQLQTSHDIAALDELVSRFTSWLKSIGPSNHVAHMLGSLVASQQRKLRPDLLVTTVASTWSNDSLPFDPTLLYPEIISAEMFDINAGDLWPTWDATL